MCVVDSALFSSLGKQYFGQTISQIITCRISLRHAQANNLFREAARSCIAIHFVANDPDWGAAFKTLRFCRAGSDPWLCWSKQTTNTNCHNHLCHTKKQQHEKHNAYKKGQNLTKENHQGQNLTKENHSLLLGTWWWTHWWQRSATFPAVREAADLTKTLTDPDQKRKCQNLKMENTDSKHHFQTCLEFRANGLTENERSLWCSAMNHKTSPERTKLGWLNKTPREIHFYRACLTTALFADIWGCILKLCWKPESNLRC